MKRTAGGLTGECGNRGQTRIGSLERNSGQGQSQCRGTKVAPTVRMRSRATASLSLLGLSALSSIGFALVARAVARRHTSRKDARVRGRFPRRRRRATKAIVTALGPLGKEYVHAPIALGLAAYVWRRGSREGAAVIPFASAASVALGRLLEARLRHRRPPPGRHSRVEPSFPSGHSLETTAVALTSAYVLGREGLVSPRILLPVALAVPGVSGAGRLYMDRHWGSDVLGGLLAGGALAAAFAAAYEASRR